MAMRAWLGICLSGALLGSLAGCGDSKLVPVEGVVKLDGKPVDGATVVFVPERSPGRPAQGFTANDGRFHLSTGSLIGAGPGDYKVLVTKTVGILPPGAEPPSADDERKMRKLRADYDKHSEKYLKALLPTSYGRSETTPLRCKVPPDQPVVLNLTSTPDMHSDRAGHP